MSKQSAKNSYVTCLIVVFECVKRIFRTFRDYAPSESSGQIRPSKESSYSYVYDVLTNFKTIGVDKKKYQIRNDATTN